MVKQYHKLVRDKIPGIIRQTGSTCSYRILEQEQYLTCLDVKLNEELAEYQQSKSLEELADLLEVMRAVVTARGYTWQELEDIRQEKYNRRGGFADRIFLEEVRQA